MSCLMRLCAPSPPPRFSCLNSKRHMGGMGRVCCLHTPHPTAGGLQGSQPVQQGHRWPGMHGDGAGSESGALCWGEPCRPLLPLCTPRPPSAPQMPAAGSLEQPGRRQGGIQRTQCPGQSWSTSCGGQAHEVLLFSLCPMPAVAVGMEAGGCPPSAPTDCPRDWRRLHRRGRQRARCTRYMRRQQHVSRLSSAAAGGCPQCRCQSV